MKWSSWSKLDSSGRTATTSRLMAPAVWNYIIIWKGKRGKARSEETEKLGI